MKTLRRILSELYGEPQVSTFTHNDHEYDLNRILSDTLGMEQVRIPVSKLKWILRWDPMTKKDNTRIRNADLSAPILVVKLKGQIVVVDGIHRLAKALQEGVEFLPAIYVPDSVMEKNRLS